MSNSSLDSLAIHEHYTRAIEREQGALPNFLLVAVTKDVTAPRHDDERHTRRQVLGCDSCYRWNRPRVSELGLVVGRDRAQGRRGSRQSETDVGWRARRAPVTDQSDYWLVTLLDDCFQEAPIVRRDRVSNV